MVGGVVGAVLDPGQDQSGEGSEHGADQAVELAADGVVVEAVVGHRGSHIVGDEQQHIGQILQDGSLEGLHGQGPQTEVSEEEVIFDEDDGIGHGHHDQSQQSAEAQLLQRHLDAGSFQIEAVLLAVAEVPQEHAGDGEQAAGGGPQTQTQSLALSHVGGVADVDQSQEDHAAEDTAGQQAQPEPQDALLVSNGSSLDHFLGAQSGEEGSEDHQHGEGADEHSQADDAHEVEGFLPLPHLVGGLDGVGSAQGLGEEVDDVALTSGGEVRPGVDDGGTVDDTQSILTLDGLVVLGVSLADLTLLAGAAEVQEHLSGVGLHEVGRAERLAVGTNGGAEELVIDGGDNGHIAVAVGVGGVVVSVGVERIVAVDQDGCDQGGLVQVVSLDSGIDGPAAHGVTGDTDAGGVDEGHAAQSQDALIDAVGLQDEEVGSDVGVTVVGLVDGQDHEAAAGQLNVVGVSHFLVVEVAVTGDDGGSLVVLGGGIGHEEVCGHHIAAVGLEGQFTHGDSTAGGLHKVDHDAAQEHQDQGDAQEDLSEFLCFFHCCFPLFCISLFRIN